MKKRTRSILQELNDLGASRNSEYIIEQRGANIVESATNLLALIGQTYDSSTAGEIERRFINAIKSGDVKKFKRGIQKVIENKKNDK
jgi:hypothetical protein|tara:strand:- start:145 stop:405 length:261 start_codon:yes stop_codon:yes gene_type:complete